MTTNGRDVEEEFGQKQQSSGMCYLIALPALLLILIFKIIPLINAFIIPFKDFRIINGVLGSSWVGMENFKQLLSNFAFSRVVSNTLILNLEYIFLCSTVTLVLALILSFVRIKVIRQFFVTLFILPYFIPTVVFSYIVMQILNQQIFSFFLQKEWLVNPSYFRNVYILLEVIKNVGISLIIALGMMNAKHSLRDLGGDYKSTRLFPALKAVGLFALIQFSSLLTTDFETLHTFLNPLVLETGETLDTFTYRTGLMNSQISSMGTIWLLKFLVQVLISVGVYFIIKHSLVDDIFANNVVKKEGGNKNILGTIIGSVSAVIVTFIFLYIILGKGNTADLAPQEAVQPLEGALVVSSFTTYLIATLITVIANGLITVTLAYPLTVKDLPGRGVYTIFLIIILNMGVNGAHDYLFLRSLGMLNTIYPHIISGLFTLINVFVLKAIFNGRYPNIEDRAYASREGDGTSFIKQYLPKVFKPLLALSALQFVVVWNSYYPSQLWYISDRRYYSPVMVFREILQQMPREAYEGLTHTIIRFALSISIPSIIIGILVVIFAGYEVFIGQIRRS
jgi:putative aldouronate transport system permease protein